MVCFCISSFEPVTQALSRLSAATPPAGTTPAATPTAQRVTSVANWLSARLLPAPAWQPDPAWAALQPPAPQMTPASLATLGTLATLRTLVMEQFGVDPLQQGKQTALARAVVTLNARLAPIAAQAAAVDTTAWTKLADTAAAAAQVAEAAQSGLFTPTPEVMDAYLAPAGLPLEEWAALLDAVTALAPLIAAAPQLGPEMTEPGNLAEAMRQLKSIAVPPLQDPLLVARLIGLFTATNTLQSVLGEDPAAAGYEAVAQLVQDKVDQSAAMIPPGAQPPRVACNPTQMAPPAVVEAAMSPGIAKLAALTWQVPPAQTLPVLANVLPAAALAKALPGSAVQRAPCAHGCDAAALMQ